MMGLVAMHWATVFCLMEIHVYVSSILASRITSASEGYYQIPLACRQGFFPVIHLVNQWWKLPRVFLMRRFTTHVSEPKRRMA